MANDETHVLPEMKLIELNGSIGKWTTDAYQTLQSILLERKGVIRTAVPEQDTIFALVVIGDELKELPVVELRWDGKLNEVRIVVRNPYWERGDGDNGDEYSLENDCWFTGTMVNIIEIIGEYL